MRDLSKAEQNVNYIKIRNSFTAQTKTLIQLFVSEYEVVKITLQFLL